MRRPKVTVYNEISIDGRIEGFSQDVARYYRMGFRWRPDAILMGSRTALNFGPPESVDDQARELPPPEKLPIVEGFEELVYEPRPLLVVPDSHGRVRNWIHALAQPWYRSILVLVTETTPKEYVEYLLRRRIDVVAVGEHSVDLPGALERIAADYGVQSVRTDSGGGLNGALLAAGLVDEIALIVTPVVSGLPAGQTLVSLEHPLSDGGVALDLAEFERLHDGALWVRYRLGA